MRTSTIAALTALALGLLWLLWPQPDVVPAGFDAVRDSSTTVARVATTEDVSGEPNPQPQRQQAVTVPVPSSRAANPASERKEWCVQLTGIDPDTPWTSPLVIVFEGMYRVQGEVDARGAMRFVPPTDARNPGIQHLNAYSSDTNYRLRGPSRRTDSLQLTGRLEIPVEQIGQLTGRCIGPSGKGLVARIRAFAWQDGQPRRRLLGRTNSATDGSYALDVPHSQQMLLIADATQSAADSVSFAAAPGPSKAQVPWHTSLETPSLSTHLYLNDFRDARTDLLPATLRTEALFQRPRELPDLQLQKAAVLTGRAILSDGRALADAWIVAQPAGTTKAAFHAPLHWSGTQLLAAANTRSNQLGQFELELAPGVPFVITATSTNPLLLAGEPSATATAPGHVDLQAPGDRIRFLVIDSGQPVADAKVEVGTSSWPTDALGQLNVTLLPKPARIRAHADVRSSAWIDLPTTARPDTITLDLHTPELAEVRLSLNCPAKLFRITTDWQQLPTGPTLTIVAERRTLTEPFALRVPTASYRLTIRDRDNTPGGPRLVPLILQVEVPPSGYTATHDLTPGGHLLLDVTTATGTHPSGTFTLTNPAGHQLTPRTLTYDPQGNARIALPGHLQADQANRLTTILPPGTYQLTLQIPSHPPTTQPAEVQANQLTRIEVRLP